MYLSAPDLFDHVEMSVDGINHSQRVRRDFDTLTRQLRDLIVDSDEGKYGSLPLAPNSVPFSAVRSLCHHFMARLEKESYPALQENSGLLPVREHLHYVAMHANRCLGSMMERGSFYRAHPMMEPTAPPCASWLQVQRHLVDAEMLVNHLLSRAFPRTKDMVQKPSDTEYMTSRDNCLTQAPTSKE